MPAVQRAFHPREVEESKQLTIGVAVCEGVAVSQLGVGWQGLLTLPSSQTHSTTSNSRCMLL